MPGSEHTIEAPDQTGYPLRLWSDGGAQQHDITVTPTTSTYTATFTAIPTVTFDDKTGQDQPLNGAVPDQRHQLGHRRLVPLRSVGSAHDQERQLHWRQRKRRATFTSSRRASCSASGPTTAAAARTRSRLSCTGQTDQDANRPRGPGRRPSAPAGPARARRSRSPAPTAGTPTSTTSSTTRARAARRTPRRRRSAPWPASSVTATGATITWTTNEASDTQVEYGTTTALRLVAPRSTPAMVTSHSHALSGLTPSTLYHYRVKSKDAAGNLATSADFTFTTARAADTTPPTISAVPAGSDHQPPAPRSPGRPTRPPTRRSSTARRPPTARRTTLATRLVTSPLASRSAGSRPARCTTTASRARTPPATWPRRRLHLHHRGCAADGNQTITFDDKSGQDQPLNGQYPAGVINWGTGGWYHSGPWGLFTTKSASFGGPARPWPR